MEKPARKTERRRETEIVGTISLARTLSNTKSMEDVRNVLQAQLFTAAGTTKAWVVICVEGKLCKLAGSSNEHGEGVDITSLAEQVMNFDSEVAANTNGITLCDQICFLLNSGENIGVLGVPQDSGDDRERRQRLVSIATFIAMAIRNVKLLVEIEKNIFLDGLTGCFNKTHGMKMLDAELKRAKRTRNTFSVIMFDLDSFKSINDEHGHLCGDALLTALGKRMQELLRNSDVKCRYGGEEFLVLLPDTSIEGAVHAAEILRQEISKLSVLWKGELVSTTASVGVTVSKTRDLDATVLIERVDAALYRAKHLGRNQVYIDEGADENRLGNPEQSINYF